MKTKLIVLLVCISSFSISVKAQSGDSSIPVRLKSFDAVRADNANKLNWIVTCFLEYANFEIQRSSDGIHYNPINSFQADRLRCRQPFNYEDRGVNGKVFYRIRVGDLDGRFYTSKITVVIGKLKGYEIASMVPTLVSSNATITISSADYDKVNLRVTNLQGITMYRKSLSLVKGNNNIRIDLSALPKGNYVLSSVNSEEQLKTIRFVKL